MFLKLFPRYAGRARRGATVAGDNLRGTAVVVENAPKSLSRHDGASVIRACRQRCDELVAETLVVPFCVIGCLRCLLLVMCMYPFVKKALTLYLARGESRECYFDCNLMQRKVLASSHQHLMAEAPSIRYAGEFDYKLRNG